MAACVAFEHEGVRSGSFPVGAGSCVCRHAPLPHKHCPVAGHSARVQYAEALHVIDGDADTGSVRTYLPCFVGTASAIPLSVQRWLGT